MQVPAWLDQGGGAARPVACAFTSLVAAVVGDEYQLRDFLKGGCKDQVVSAFVVCWPDVLCSLCL